MVSLKVKKMENGFQQTLGSYRFWIFGAALAYFLYSVYFAIYGLSFSVGLIYDDYVFNLVSQDPWWWGVLYYGSEGVFGFVSGLFRAIAGFFAAYASFLFWRKIDLNYGSIKSTVSKALLFEATYFVSLSMTVVASFSYFLSGDQFYYFDGTPGLIYVMVAGVPLLAMILCVAPTLLTLRKKIAQNAGKEEIGKWACLTGVAYLFVVFWFNYTLSWVGVLVPYARVHQQFGLSFLLSSTNLVTFLLTVVGLLFVAFCGLKVTLPTIHKKPIKLNPKHVGLLAVAVGSYFWINTLLYYANGGYDANPSVWYEVIGPRHNPYFWCLTLLFLGLAVILSFNKTKK